MHEHVISSDLLRGNPLGDPHDRPLLVYTPPGYDDSPDRAYPAVYVIQGYTGHVAMWRNRSAFRQPFPETADAMFARGDAPPAVVVYVGRLDRLRRQPVRRLARHRALPLVPLRRGRAVRRRELPDDPRRRPPGDHGQVERRLRRHDHADAAARSVRRAGDARGRRALRVLLHPGVPASPSGTCGSTTATSSGGGTTSGPGCRSPSRRTMPLSCCSASPRASPPATTAPPAAVRPGHRPAAAGRVATVAGLGPGADGAALRRRPAGSAASGSTPGPATISIWTSARRPSGRRCSTRGARRSRSTSSSSTTHAGIDYRYPLSLAWLCQRMAD